MITCRKIWEEMAQEHTRSAGYARRRVPLNAGLEVFVSLSYPEERPCLIFEVDFQSLPLGKNYPVCKGFSLSTHILQPESRRRAMMVLELLDRQYMDVFVVLVDDVLSCLKVAADEKEGIKIFLNRVQRWKDFFEKQKDDVLSELEQQGLYGELWVMFNYLIPTIKPELAVASWKGPEGANQDYHIASFAIEVKTSTSNPHEKIIISNVLQMDNADLAGLFLVHLALDPRAGTGETLPGIITAIRQYLDDKAPHMTSTFNALLIKAGYFEFHADKYSAVGYILRHDHYYHVQGDFPRLLESQLPKGVGDVRYSITISSCLKHIVTPEQISTMLTGESRS